MNKKNGFFTSDFILNFFPFVSALILVAMIITAIVSESILSFSVSIFSDLIVLVLLFGLKSTYKSHDKNVMKAIMGALVVSLVLINAENIFTHIVYFDLIWVYEGTGSTISNVFDFVIFIGIILIAINHFVINYDHHSNPGKIKFNQILGIIVLLASIGGFVAFLFDPYDTQYPVLIATNAEYYIFFITVYLAVISVESKLDDFRVAREEKKANAAK